MEKYVQLTKVLFTESKIPQQSELGRIKLSHLLQFGLHWFCTKILLRRGI